MRINNISFAWFAQRHTLPYFDLNLRRQQDVHASKGALIFGAGLVCILVLSGDYFYLRYKMNILERSLVHPVVIKQGSIAVRDKDEAEQIQHALGQLTIPWGRLFAALESNSSDKVRIFSLDPESANHTFTLSAEAESMKDMMDYVKALSSQKSLKDVHLLTQQSVAESKKDSLQFTLEGSWESP